MPDATVRLMLESQIVMNVSLCCAENRAKPYRCWTKSRVLGSVFSIYLTFIVVSLHAAVYYVDTTTGNDANSGTQMASAWKSLPGTVGPSGSGWVNFNSGDTIYVKGGSINNVQWYIGSTSQFAGSAAWDSIRIVSGDQIGWGTGKAVIDGQSTRTYGIMIGDNAAVVGITIDGFEVRNIAAGALGGSFDPVSGSCCVAIGGNGSLNHIKVRNCWLHDAQRTIDNTGHGFSLGNGTYVWAENNVIGPNIGTKGMDIYHWDYGVIRSNVFIHTGDHCISLNANHWDIYDNVMYLTQSNAVHGPIYGLKIELSYNDAWNNVVYRLPGNESSSLEPCGIGLFEGGNNRIVHNTTYEWHDPGDGREYGGGIAIGCEGNSTSNCIVKFNISRFSINQYGGNEFFMYNICPANTIAYNDFFHQSGTSETVSRIADVSDNGTAYNAASLNSVVTNNCTIKGNVQIDPAWSGSLTSSFDINGVPNTAWFGAFSDASVAASLSTINDVTGGGGYGFDQSAGKFAMDIIGRPRLNWTMGAFEYAAGTSSSPPPAPTNLHVVSVGP